MKEILDFSNARIYVGTYAKYNDASNFGSWINVFDCIDIDDFYETCREIYNDEIDPEFMFQDYENIPDGLVTESWISDHLFDVISMFRQIGDDRSVPLLIWLNNNHRSLAQENIHDLVEDFDCEYIGLYDSKEDFARFLIDEIPDLPDILLRYFDYEAYANDVFQGDFWIEDGYVFLCS